MNKLKMLDSIDIDYIFVSMLFDKQDLMSCLVVSMWIPYLGYSSLIMVMVIVMIHCLLLILILVRRMDIAIRLYNQVFVHWIQLLRNTVVIHFH